MLSRGWFADLGGLVALKCIWVLDKVLGPVVGGVIGGVIGGIVGGVVGGVVVAVDNSGIVGFGQKVAASLKRVSHVCFSILTLHANAHADMASKQRKAGNLTPRVAGGFVHG